MTTSPRTRAAIATAALFAACATDQAADVATWRREVTLGDAPAFESGAPLTLAAAIRLANEANERIGLGGEDFLQAVIGRARINANFLPSVDLAASYTWRQRTATGIPFLDNPTLLDVPVHTELTLFDGWRDHYQADAASLTIEQRRSLLLDLRETVVLEVVQAYYRTLRAERRTATFAQAIATAQQRVADAAARERFGTGTALDRAIAQSASAGRTLDHIAASSDVKGGRTALSLLTGVDVSASPLTDGFVLPAERPAIDALLVLAHDHRQDLRAAALGAEAARSRVEVAFGQYYPSIGVSLDWFITRDSLPVQRDWSSFLTLNLPLFSGGRIAADVAEAWSLFRQEVLRYSLLRREIAADLALAIDALAAADQRLLELQRQVAADTEVLARARAGVRVGLVTAFDLQSSDDQLRNSTTAANEAEFVCKTAWLEVLRVCGALTAGSVDVAVPPPPPPRPAPTSPFVHTPGQAP